MRNLTDLYSVFTGERRDVRRNWGNSQLYAAVPRLLSCHSKPFTKQGECGRVRRHEKVARSAVDQVVCARALIVKRGGES